MKRTTIWVCALAAAISGCATQTERGRSTYSSPILSTPASPSRRIIPATPPKPAQPPALQQPAITWDERQWIPPGGIRRGQWRTIVVHHSANTVDTPESMDNYHRQVKRWNNGLGYHFVIGNGVNTTDGQIYVGSRWKNQIEGAHCKTASGTYLGSWRPSNYFNEHGIGICLVGNFENSRPTNKQLAALQRLVSFLCSKTGISPYQVYGHGEVTHKTACPGKNLQRELAMVRSSVARSLAMSWTPDQAPGWFSRLYHSLALAAQANDDGLVFVRDTLVESIEIADEPLLDSFDHVTDLDLGSFRLAAGYYVDHHHSERRCVDVQGSPHDGCQIGQPHAAP